MRICKWILIILFCFSANGISAKKNKADSPWFFVQISDPQFGFFDKNESIEKEIALYEEAVRKINLLKPDFVVITGDFVNKRTEQNQTDAFRKITAKIDKRIPVYYTPGNHDIGNTPGQKDIDAYTAIYGPDYFSFKHKNSTFIGFNSVIIKSEKNKELEEKQFAWLEKQLKKAQKSNLTILFTHYPFFIKRSNEKVTYSNQNEATRERYMKLFSKYGVMAIFAGHYHNNGQSSFDKIMMITTSALGRPLGKAPSGLRLITINKDKISHNYYSVDEFPESFDPQKELN